MTAEVSLILGGQIRGHAPDMLLIYPQGTRSVRLTRGRPGVGQIALHFDLPILPVGCSGGDDATPSDDATRSASTSTPTACAAISTSPRA